MMVMLLMMMMMVMVMADDDAAPPCRCPELRRVLVFLFPPVLPVAAAHTSERGNTSQKVIWK